MRSLLSEFRQFILRGNVVDLAVGIVIGVAFTGVVQALVRDFINPLIAALFGKPDFSRFHFTVHHAVFAYGDFINRALILIIIGMTVFFLVVRPVNAMIDIPLKATRCPNCTSELAPPARDRAAARV